MVAGTLSGEVLFMKIRNIELKAPIITAVRIFRYDGYGWDNKVIANCYFCGQVFIPEESVFKTIENIERMASFPNDEAPCLKLPKEAWDETRLLSECPHCHKPLRFNPFVVDNKKRHSWHKLGE